MAVKRGISEIAIPHAFLVPVLWSPAAGDELPADKGQHTLDLLFDFYTKIDESPPATGEWRIWSPRCAGFLGQENTADGFDGMINDNGTSTSLDLVLKKNGTTVMGSALTIT